MKSRYPSVAQQRKRAQEYAAKHFTNIGKVNVEGDEEEIDCGEGNQIVRKTSFFSSVVNTILILLFILSLLVLGNLFF